MSFLLIICFLFYYEQRRLFTNDFSVLHNKYTPPITVHLPLIFVKIPHFSRRLFIVNKFKIITGISSFQFSLLFLSLFFVSFLKFVSPLSQDEFKEGHTPTIIHMPSIFSKNEDFMFFQDNFNDTISCIKFSPNPNMYMFAAGSWSGDVLFDTLLLLIFVHQAYLYSLNCQNGNISNCNRMNNINVSCPILDLCWSLVFHALF